jgi:hypothetical protein
MPDQNLVINIIPFEAPVTDKVFSFTTEKKPGFKPISKWECMYAYKNLFEEEDKDKSIQHLYTDFSEKAEGTESIEIDLTKSWRFAKHYYSWLIFNHFKTVADIINSNFVKDVELWFADKSQDTELYNAYKTFTIKVQVAVHTETPEMIISYDGVSLVHKESILDLDVDTTIYTRVVYENQIYQYDNLPDEAKSSWEKVYPVLNNTLKYMFEIPVKTGKSTSNRYKIYKSNLDSFISTFIKIDTFRAVIPVNGISYLKVDTIKIKNTTPGSNLLQFRQNQTDIVPYSGLSKWGPYEHCPDPHINMFFIFHESHRDTSAQLYKYFRDGYKNFKPLKHLLQKPINITKDDHIVFTNFNNPLPEIKKALSLRSFDSTQRYIAIYISPISKQESDPVKHRYYFQIKEELLKYSVTSQVVDVSKIANPDFNYSLVNIGIAILAKLNGVPWRLHRTLQNELVIGVGAFKSSNSTSRYIGSAFCFSNDGHFKGFECYAQNDLMKLAVSISKAIKGYRSQNDEIKRLVIHFYKTMNKREIAVITNEMKEMGLDIPVIIVTINKTESKDLVLFDLNCPELIPVSGTFIKTGFNQYLLCNNTRYETSLPKPTEGYPFPIKLNITSTHPQLLDNQKLINELIDQVYQFSRMYWKSVRQQNLPVTIKYPEMVAEIFPHFDSQILPEFGKNNLWFL